VAFPVALASVTAFVAYAGVIEYGSRFKRLLGWSTIHGFIALTLVTAVLDPFEIRRYANGKVRGRGLLLAALTVVPVVFPLTKVLRFWAVPFGTTQYHLVVFVYHRLWTIVDRPTISASE
jgi:hypothetical protein